MRRLLDAIRARPHRVVEVIVAALGLAAALGLDLDVEARNAILALLVAVVGGSEVAQTRTTPLHRPRDADGKPLAPVNGVPDERGAD